MCKSSRESRDDDWQHVKSRTTHAPKPNLRAEALRNRMCDSIETQKPCRHGACCRFAHSVSELVFSSCLFGTSCRNVKYQDNGVYTIVSGKTCNRSHPSETNASVCKRIGIKVDPVLKPSPVLKPDETIIRVPKEFAMQAMELAIKSGKKNILLEII